MPPPSPSRSRPPVLVWFRDDQRLADNPALGHAVTTGHPVVCVYVHDPAPRETRAPGAAARWWLHESLRELNAALAAMGGALTFLQGSERKAIETFAAAIGATEVCWNRRYSVGQRETDAAIKTALKEHGTTVSTFNGHLLREPWTITRRNAQPFQMFMPYWRAARSDYFPEPPRAAPGRINFFSVPDGTSCVKDLSDLALQPTAPDWAGGLRETWQCGEEAGRSQLQAFLTGALPGYASARDIPAMHSTSRLSPYLRFGNLSARQVWHGALLSAADASARPGNSPRAAIESVDLHKFLDELGWREFSYYLLYHLAPLHQVNFRREFDAMPWRADPDALRAWQRGKTGYPLVDAGMRELWRTGWMHNRVRMVAASFLVKHLLIDWREGEAWFWDTLVDADEANNPASWQWVAGCGADAAPYFRIFNPVIQGKKFDPQGDYVRRWVPELARLQGASIHAPWLAQPAELTAASVRLGHDYPLPVVSHHHARMRALEAVDGLRERASRHRR